MSGEQELGPRWASVMAGGPAQGCVLCGIIEGFYASHHSTADLKRPYTKEEGWVCVNEVKGAAFRGGCSGANK